ncbi:MAG: ATP-binding protein [Caldilineaceae bacterium]|nr:ATP-binding protein [Caldilineaceae bacterium]
MAHIRQAITARPDGKKPFIVLHGPPGVGKTWLFEQIRELCSTAGVRCADVVPADSMLADPNAKLTELLRWCLQDDTAEISSVPTKAEIVQDLSNRLDNALRTQSQPLAFFFDDLDHWINWSPQDPRLQRIYQHLWWAVLRHTHVPGLVICTSREPLPAAHFNARMKRKLALISVSSLQDRINRLITGIVEEMENRPDNPVKIDADKLKSLTERYACGHPLVVDWLAWKLSQNGSAFEKGAADQSLSELAGLLIDGRLSPNDEELLIRLARDFPGGFADTDSVLDAEGPRLVNRLKQVGLIDLIPGTPRYQVLPPLVCLYQKEGSNG